ncbi:MAG: SpoIIE family protein phosphatase [Micromonosporaceae bacterium]|nr:SpoIIE family protein phosphatase [Micromonosporaceae bacterium]
MVSRGARNGRGAVAVIVALFAGVFLLRWGDSRTMDAIAVLYVIPVALVAARFGVWAGASAAALASGLTIAWNVLDDGGLGITGIGIRLAVFLVIGVIVGLLADRVGQEAQERQRLLAVSQRISRRGDQARQLQVLVGRLSRAATPQEVAEAYTSEGLRLLGASRGAVYLLEPGETAMRRVAAHRPRVAGGTWEIVPLTASAPMTEVLRTGAPQYLGTVEELREAYPHLAGECIDAGDQAWVAMPLSGSQGAMGVLTAAYPIPQGFGSTSRETLTLVAFRVSDALERSRLLEETNQERTRAEQSEQRTALLADVATVLAGSLEAAERMQRLLDRLIPAFAEFATVELVNGSRLETLAAVHADPALLPSLRDLSAADGWDSWGIREVLRHRRASLLTDMPDNSPTQELTRIGTCASPGDVRPRSLIALPLKARESLIGILVLGRTRPDWQFTQADLMLAELIAGRASLALDNAQLYERQRDVAARLQRALLPAELPTAPGVSAAAHYQSGGAAIDVGGDWYDLIKLSEDRVGIVLGDVVGSGIVAAATMGRLRSAVAALAPDALGPADLLQRVDRFADAADGARLATAICADFEPATGCLRYACAGHPPPVLISETGTARLLYGGRGAPLATAPGRSRSQDEVVIDRTATLICYSDGLIERRGQDVDSRLGQLLEAATQLAGLELVKLCEGLLAQMIGDDPLDDDVALLCLRLERIPTMRFHEVLPAAAGYLSALRGRLRRWADGIGLDQNQTADLLLAIGEACANTIEHAYRNGRPPGSVDVRVEHDPVGAVVVRISDTGRWRVCHEPIAFRGRGLALMRAAMDSVEVDSTQTGTTVTMRTTIGATRPSQGGIDAFHP